MQKKQAAIVLATSQSAVEAYQKLHPDCKPESAKSNAWRLLEDPAIQEEVNKLVAKNLGFKVDKQTIVTLLSVIITGGLKGTESTRDMLDAIKVLTKLVPEFKDHIDLTADISKKSEAELDSEIEMWMKKLGERKAPNAESKN